VINLSNLQFENSTDDWENISGSLLRELQDLEGIHSSQNPENGDSSSENTSYISKYTNRIFGMPYQLLDNVDKRFSTINSYLGNEYLRNFVLNSPILHIKPGMPKYTGGTDTSSLQDIVTTTTLGDSDMISTAISTLAKNTIFGSGSKIQRRMFGFRETYYDYMQHVNYMCRSAAIYMELTTGEKFPNGTYLSNNNYSEFENIDWSDYRMLSDSTPLSPWEYFRTLLADMGKDIASKGSLIASLVDIKTLLGLDVNNKDYEEDSLNIDDINASDNESLLESILGIKAYTKAIQTAWNNASSSNLVTSLSSKTASVCFMVDPIQYSETLTNRTKTSSIEEKIDSLTSSIGSEIQFITGSGATEGALGSIANLLGDTLSSAATNLVSLSKSVTGGFLSNVFSGAIQSIKGQKMIYPKIYEMSESEANYEFDITLESPYGDPYNYYMNIVVPLCHLIALASPRMVTSNSTTSPFLVQAYIPGMITCQMGIISSMSITKNPDGKHVSVDGFPLTVKVHFTIEELYNAMAISPANDPASFLYNETLNDYLANLSGLIPSVDTYAKQRSSMFNNLGEYFSSGEYINDAVSTINEKIEDFINPYY
jgi:hypothetical protein